MNSIEPDERSPSKLAVFAPVVDRSPFYSQPQRNRKGRYLAAFLALILVVPGLVAVSPFLVNQNSISPDDLRAGVDEMGDREVTYTLSNFFELYTKSTDYGDLGSVDDMGTSERGVLPPLAGLATGRRRGSQGSRPGLPSSAPDGAWRSSADEAMSHQKAVPSREVCHLLLVLVLVLVLDLLRVLLVFASALWPCWGIARA